MDTKQQGHEAEPLIGRKATLTVRRGGKGSKIALHGTVQDAGGVGVLLASGASLALFPWSTIESCLVQKEPEL